MSTAPALHFTVWSDYLCPWCYNAAVRLRRIEEEYAGRVTIAWRSYLLRPHPQPGRDLERFRAYTESWRGPAAEPDAGTFQVWQGDAGPPSHSVPPHLVAKAAAALSPEAFARVHERLLRAYFAENRDVSDPATLLALWRELGLPEDAFARAGDPDTLRAVLAEHDDAVEQGVTGVPTVQLRGTDALVVGAQPLAVYRRWVDRMLARAGAEA
jgi:predicted DsbA family dithiol-disulfide isomerase